MSLSVSMALLDCVFPCLRNDLTMFSTSVMFIFVRCIFVLADLFLFIELDSLSCVSLMYDGIRADSAHSEWVLFI